MTSTQQDEETPLLQENGQALSDCGKPAPWRPLVDLLPFIMMLLAFEIAAFLSSTSLTQIEEGIICRKYYPGIEEPATDARCKSTVVQSEFSTLIGWESTFALIPGLLTAVPYGIVADRYGRRIVIVLSLIGFALSVVITMVVCRFPEIFDIRLIWFGATMCVVGGGPYVFIAMIFTIASDISTDAQRSTTFFYLTAVALGVQLIAAPITFIAMERGAWFAASAGFLGFLFSIVIAIASPETRRVDTTLQTEQNLDNSDDSARQDDPIPRHGLWPRISHAVGQAATSMRCLFWENKMLGLFLLTVLFTTLGRYVAVIQMQYVTKRFSWSYSQAGLLSSVNAAISLILMVLILPFVNRILLVELQLRPLFKDLWLARASIIALVVGTFGIGIANRSPILILSLIVSSCGIGYGPAMRSILTVMAEDRHIGLLFTAMSVLENLGSLIAGPLMAAAFRVGLAWGEPWIGLPFIAAGCLLTCAAVIVFCVPISEKDDTSKLLDDRG